MCLSNSYTKAPSADAIARLFGAIFKFFMPTTASTTETVDGGNADAAIISIHVYRFFFEKIDEHLINTHPRTNRLG